MLGMIDLLNQAPVIYGHDDGLESPPAKYPSLPVCLQS